MNTQIIIDTMRLAYQYLGKAVADNAMPNCAIPVETAFKRVGLVLAELESGESESGITKPPSTGVELIAQERERQMSVEGWDAKHDAAHLKAELTQAAICYAADVAAKYETPKWSVELRSFAIHFWPWDKQWWKPTPDDPVRQLVKAGALVAAEIDRLQRQQGNVVETNEKRDCACLDSDARRCFELRYPNRKLDDIYEPYEKCGCSCHAAEDDECDCYECKDRRIV